MRYAVREATYPGRATVALICDSHCSQRVINALLSGDGKL